MARGPSKPPASRAEADALKQVARTPRRKKGAKETPEQRNARQLLKRLQDIHDQAQQAVERDKSGINPDMFRLLTAGNVLYEFEQWFEKDDSHPDGGAWVRSRRGRRTNNVFETLYKAKTIEQRQRVAGNYLVALYAESQGLEGIPDKEQSGEKGESNPHERMMRSALAGQRLSFIMGSIEKSRYKRLLRALVRDIVLGDGAGNDVDGGVRWRRVIRESIGCRSDKAQSAAVKLATAGLYDLIERCEVEWLRRRKEERRKAEDEGATGKAA